MKMPWKNLGNFSQIPMKLEFIMFLEEINDQKRDLALFSTTKSLS